MRGESKVRLLEHQRDNSCKQCLRYATVYIHRLLPDMLPRELGQSTKLVKRTSTL